MNPIKRTSLGTLATLTAVAMVVTLTGGCGGGGQDAGHAPAQPAAGNAAKPAPATAGTPAPTGTAGIGGTIRFEGAVPNLRPLQMDADPGCAKKHSSDVASELLVLGEGKTVGNIFVSVKSGLPAGSFPVPAEPVVLNQKGCQYSPHVMGVMVGQTFKVLNSDELLHNVHSLPKINASFNRAMPANVKEADYSFTKPEPMFMVKCDVHPWMNAWVTVLEHPYFSVTGTDGKFQITGLPAGTYEIEAWHEKMGSKTATVTVADGETKTADMTFSM